MDKKKKLIILVSVCVLLVLCGVVTYTIISSKATSLLTESSSSASKDESGVDWSKYQVYDVDLGSGNVNITKAGVYNLKGTLKNGTIKDTTEAIPKTIPPIKENVFLVPAKIALNSRLLPSTFGLYSENNTALESPPSTKAT